MATSSTASYSAKQEQHISSPPTNPTKPKAPVAYKMAVPAFSDISKAANDVSANLYNVLFAQGLPTSLERRKDKMLIHE